MQILSMQKKILFTVVALLIAVPVANAVECYSCYYDETVPDFGTIYGIKQDVDCQSDKITPSNVDTRGGFTRCYASLLYRDGQLVSVVRGGNYNNFNEFTVKAGRNSQEYVTTYCSEDLCNSAPVLSSGLALLVLSLFAIKLS